MVIVRLNGGLGNQMFQYAAGRRLSYIRHTELKVDTTAFDDPRSRRSYGLEHYNVVSTIATPQEIRRFTVTNPSTPWKFLYRLIGSTRPKGFILERHFHFDPKILELPSDAYLSGDWQSAKYFEDIRDVLLKEFTVKEPPTRESAALLSEIACRNSVALHVRRTDYVTNPHTNRFHGACGVDYYRRAISLICQRVEKPHFYLFSDDPEWTRANLKLDPPATYVNHNGPGQAYDDMRLMAACKHFIIANSSFSWWAAWLSTNGGKIVIGPTQWFRQSPHNTQDLLPPEWLCV